MVCVSWRIQMQIAISTKPLKVGMINDSMQIKQVPAGKKGRYL